MSEIEKHGKTRRKAYRIQTNILKKRDGAEGGRLPLPRHLGEEKLSAPGGSTRDQNTGPTIVLVV